jgi:hypothetical protein
MCPITPLHFNVHFGVYECKRKNTFSQCETTVTVYVVTIATLNAADKRVLLTIRQS